jgi:hypothetical protein
MKQQFLNNNYDSEYKISCVFLFEQAKTEKQALSVVH